MQIVTELESDAPRPDPADSHKVGAVTEQDADLPWTAVEQPLAAKEPL